MEVRYSCPLSNSPIFRDDPINSLIFRDAPIIFIFLILMNGPILSSLGMVQLSHLSEWSNYLIHGVRTNSWWKLNAVAHSRHLLPYLTCSEFWPDAVLSWAMCYLVHQIKQSIHIWHWCDVCINRWRTMLRGVFETGRLLVLELFSSREKFSRLKGSSMSLFLN